MSAQTILAFTLSILSSPRPAPARRPRADGKLSFFSLLACTEPYYGRWAFLADGATRANGVVENWFELIDAWFDAPDESGGLNGYRW